MSRTLEHQVSSAMFIARLEMLGLEIRPYRFLSGVWESSGVLSRTLFSITFFKKDGEPRVIVLPWSCVSDETLSDEIFKALVGVPDLRTANPPNQV